MKRKISAIVAIIMALGMFPSYIVYANDQDDLDTIRQNEEMELYDTLNQAQQDLKTKSQDYDQANSDYQASRQVENLTQQQYDNTVTEFNASICSINAYLNSLINTQLLDVQTTRQSLDQAQTQYDSSLENKENAQMELAQAEIMNLDLEQDLDMEQIEEKIAQKEQALSAAQMDLDTKQAELNEALSAYNQSNDVLNGLETISSAVNTHSFNNLEALTSDESLIDLLKKSEDAQNKMNEAASSLSVAIEDKEEKEEIYNQAYQALKNAKETNADISKQLENFFKTPVMVSGKESEWTKGTEQSVSFESSSNSQYFLNVTVDGNIIDPDQYSLANESTIITLNPDYLNTLQTGSHTISIVSENGVVSASLNIIEESKEEKSEQVSSQIKAVSHTPYTGIKTQLMPMAFLALASILMGVYTKYKMHTK